jgi:hypothetical protein
VKRAVDICDKIADQLRWESREEREGVEALDDCEGSYQDEIGLTDHLDPPNLLALLHNPDPPLTSSAFNALWQQTAHIRAKIVGEVIEVPSSQSLTLDQQLSSSRVIASQQNEEDPFTDLQGNEEAPFEDLEMALRLATRPFPDLKACTYELSSLALPLTRAVTPTHSGDEWKRMSAWL